MQRTADRQKTLAVHGVLLSDDRLPMTTLDVRDLTAIDGRILVHGEEEASGRSYLMLEGTDGQVYHIYRTPEMEELRSQRGLQTNSFIRLRKFSTVRGPVVEIQDMGDSEAVLRNKAHFRETAREMIRRGVYPQDGGWNGWLGRYQKALVDAAFALEQRQAKERERRKSSRRWPLSAKPAEANSIEKYGRRRGHVRLTQFSRALGHRDLRPTRRSLSRSPKSCAARTPFQAARSTA